jgi:hypothetical protein
MNQSHLKILKNLAASKNYGSGPDHALQVSKLALNIYDEMVKIKLLNDNPEDRVILEAAAVLHDIGHPQEPHHETGFDFLADEIPKLTAEAPISNAALSTLLTSVLWHNERNFLQRGNIEIIDRNRSEKVAAIIRVADGLAMTPHPAIETLSLSLAKERLKFIITAGHVITPQLERAKTKSDLMKSVFALQDITFEQKKKQIKIIS